MRIRLSVAFLFLAMLSIGDALAQNPPANQKQTNQFDPATLPTKDSHDNLLVAVDPYVDAARYKLAFGKNSPFEAGIMVVQVYLRNDNDSPIRVDFKTVELMVALPGQERQHLMALPPEEVANRALLKADANPTIARGLPLPNLHKSGPGKAWNEMVDYLHSVGFPEQAVPAHGTTHGFLYFDMNHNFGAIRYAHLYIPDLSFVADRKALLFFDIDLGASGTR